MPVAKPLHLRLFLEGLEVPVISATVQAGPNAPACASIQVVPLDESMRLKPRTMVHLFFLERGLKKEAGKFAGLLDEYRLLFSGEVMGFSFVQTPNSRSVVLQCADFSSYWDACHATVLEYGPGGNALHHQGAVYGGNVTHFDDIVNTTSDLLVRWVSQRPQTPGLTDVSGLAGGVIRMLEAMGGVTNHSRGVNDFFTLAELRCRLLSQVCAEEKDDTASRLLSAKVFDEWIRQGLQNIGQQVTFRDLMKLLFSYVYYEAVPNPAAKFDEHVVGVLHQGKTVPMKIGATPDGRSVLARIDAHLPVIQRLLPSIETEMLQSWARSMAEELVEPIAALGRLGAKSAGARSARGQLEAARASLESIRTTEKVKGSAYEPVQKALVEARRLLAGAAAETVPVREKDSTETVSQRLKSHILRPDCFFSAPPRCNVIFPEHYSQIAYDRMFTDEATRVQVSFFDSLIGPDALLSTRVLAPNVGDNSKIFSRTIGKAGYRDLMRHELHTGIIPRFEKLSNVAAGSVSQDKQQLQRRRISWGESIAMHHFFKYRYAGRSLQVAGRFNPYVVAGFPGLVITRPWVVKGVSEKGGLTQQMLSALQTSAMNPGSGAPSQMVGMVENVAHSVNQEGGTTNLSMHHVRHHLGVDDEFIASYLKETRSQLVRIQVPLRRADVAASPKLRRLLEKVTPQGAPLETATSWVKETRASQVTVPLKTVEAAPEGGEAPAETVAAPVQKTVMRKVVKKKAADTLPYVTRGTIWKGPEDVLVPFPPTPLGDGAHGVLVGVEVRDATVTQEEGKNLFESVVLHEELELQVQASIPIEEVLRPSWFAKSYSNTTIGERIYQPFFGCGSIIDNVAFEGASPIPLAARVEMEPALPAQNTDELIARAELVATQAADTSIERAVNLLSLLYGLVKAQGLDVDEFVRDFTWRPIATYTDMLGDAGLEDALYFEGTRARLLEVAGPEGLARPRVGFHSLALSRKAIQAGALTGLLDDASLSFHRLGGTGKSESVPPEYDVRAEKLERVERYLVALTGTRGFAG